MSKPLLIVATPVFKATLKKLSAFLTRKYGASVADEAQSVIKQQVLELSTRPFSFPISERLSTLGFMDYRQMLVDRHNLVIYRIKEDENKIVLIAVMDSRQSIEQLLYETMLIL